MVDNENNNNININNNTTNNYGQNIKRRNVTVVFGSGGINSAAYIGACYRLKELGVVLQQCSDDSGYNNDSVVEVVGCSGGAIIGFMLCLGCDWKQMLDVSHQIHRAIQYDKAINVYTSMGLDSMTGIREVLKSVLRTSVAATTTATTAAASTTTAAASTAAAGGAHDPSAITMRRFADITGKRFKCCATNVSRGELAIFGPAESPDVSLLDAVTASACIPFVFAPINIGGELFVDGAMMDSFPCNYATVWGGGGDDDADDVIFAFKTVMSRGSRDEAGSNQIANVLQFSMRVVDMMTAGLQASWSERWRASSMAQKKKDRSSRVRQVLVNIECKRDGFVSDDGVLKMSWDTSVDLVRRGYFATRKNVDVA